MLREDFLTDLDRLKDEIAVELSRQGTHSRQLSLGLAKLDEASHWIIDHCVKIDGTHLVIDKRVYGRGLKAVEQARGVKAVRSTVETG